ncbi:MAG TPA: sugar phosphate nucleotidyltransferase, partial [bacterium]|nr:sugar phosphate nucleotidyltransferase [bacterium]
MSQKVRKVVIPVAGMGTRFLPVTKSVPKELLPVGTKPILQIVIEEAAASGVEEIILVTSPEKAGIWDYFRNGTSYDLHLNGINKGYLLEGLRSIIESVKFTPAVQEEPKGLGHAILCAKEAVGDEPFLVILPDVIIDSAVPCCAQLISAYERTGCAVNATEHTPKSHLHLYGIYDIASSEGRFHRARG